MSTITIHTRRGTADDVPAMFHVRTSVVHNHLSEHQLAQRGITPPSLSKQLTLGQAYAWAAEVDASLVGFSLLDIESRCITALFVLPQFEHLGTGTKLLQHAINKLQECEQTPIWLHADPSTPAYKFYLKRGWQDMGRPIDAAIAKGDVLMRFLVSSHAEN